MLHEHPDQLVRVGRGRKGLRVRQRVNMIFLVFLAVVLDIISQVQERLACIQNGALVVEYILRDPRVLVIAR